MNHNEHQTSHMNGVPDNSAIIRRMRVQAEQRGSIPGALGDYVADLPHRVLSTKGGAGQTGGRGPMDSPVIEAPRADTEHDLLKQIRDLLKRMPEALSNEWRTKFIMPPRESISFIAPGGSTTVAAGTAVAIVSQTVQERYTGFLTKVGVGVAPTGAFSDVTWQIRINGAIHPEFSNRIFFQGTLSTPLDFNFELTQARTIQLVAVNGGAVPVECQGLLVGWTEYMSSYKAYGASPATGIA